MTTTKYVHVRNPENIGRGGATVAFDIIDTEEGRLIYTSIAVCSLRDNFCRRIGRRIASGRLDFDPTVIMAPRGVSDRNIVSTLYTAAYDTMMGCYASRAKGHVVRSL